MRALILLALVIASKASWALTYTYITGATGSNCAAGANSYQGEQAALAACRPGVGWNYTSVVAKYNSARTTMYAEALRMSTNRREYYATFEVLTNCQFDIGDRLPLSSVIATEFPAANNDGSFCLSDCKLQSQGIGLTVSANQGNATSSTPRFFEVVADECTTTNGTTEYPTTATQPNKDDDCKIVGFSTICNTTEGLLIDGENLFAIPAANNKIRLCSEEGCVEPGASGVVITQSGSMIGTPNSTVPPAPPPSPQFGTFTGSQANMSARLVEVTGTGGERFFVWDAEEASRSSTASSGNTPGNTGTGTSSPPTGGTGDGSFMGTVPDGAPTFVEALQQFQADIAAAPIATAYQSISDSIPTGGVCPTADFDIFGTTVQLNSHCTIADQVRDLIRLVFLLMACAYAVRIFMEA